MKGVSCNSMWICALALVFAGGCGGGQGSRSAVQSTNTSKSGNAVFTYFGQPRPMATTSAGTVTVLGQAGATFSNVTLEPPPNLDDTFLAIGRSIDNENESDLYKSPFTNLGSEQLLYQSNGTAVLPNVSAYGVIGFTLVVNSGFSLESIRADGTGLTTINFTGVTNPIDGSYSLDGTNRLTFSSGSNIYIGPGTGGTPTLVQSNASLDCIPVWSPAGTKLTYAVSTGTSNYEDVVTTSAGGGATTDISPTALKNTGLLFPLDWASDGVTILAKYVPSGSGNGELITFSINNPSTYNVLTPSGDSDDLGYFSPDSSMIVITRSNTNGASPGVYTCDSAGLNQTLVLPDPPGAPASEGLSWSPFLPKETVVAASGSTFYHQASSGFLLSQNGPTFGSFVAFTANTPADAAIQSPTSSTGQAPMVFTITADAITQIGYINDYFSAGTTLALTSTPAVVVSVDATTGQIDLVAPAATAKPTVSKNADGTVTYSARFSAVYDGHGKNLAPSGASKLVADPKTGRLVSFN